ncbi:MAG: MgtC/SapB family protein [Planctomycetes bacterium]|nr:MgtC/SapB family protein [Planctomycetota bacterium]
MSNVGELECAARLAVAAVCGFAIAFDREIRGKPAGLRTHVLVSIGAAGFTLSGLLFLQESVAAMPDAEALIRSGMFRLFQGLIAGIGFIGAGTVFHEGLTVKGLTTAACVWITAAVGMMAGTGQYTLSVITTALAVLVLASFRPLEGFLHRRLTRSPSPAADVTASSGSGPRSPSDP